MTGDGVRAFAQCYFAFKLWRGVIFFGDGAPKAIKLYGSRSPARCVNVGHDAVNTIGSQEAIVDALTEAVGIDGVDKVAVGINVIIALRGSCHTKLVG